jgi:hypothetical protein
MFPTCISLIEQLIMNRDLHLQPSASSSSRVVIALTLTAATITIILSIAAVVECF